jgi:FAD/FMN-containing dehydrogenase
MNHILELRTEDLHVRVEAGVIYKELNQTLSRYDLFFPPDPGSTKPAMTLMGDEIPRLNKINLINGKGKLIHSGDSSHRRPLYVVDKFY